MSWAARRRFLIASIIIAFFAAILAVTLIATFTHAPTCSDGIQNEGEQGIDCGGPCARMCANTASPPIVRFVQAVISSPGHADLIAYVDNPNTSAEAVNIPYTITLYGENHVLVGTYAPGTFNLAPAATTPIYIPNISVGAQVVTQAFLAIDPTTITWYTSSDTRLLPTVGSPTIGGTNNQPQISATLTDPSTTPLANVSVVAVVFDTGGNVIAASSTIVPVIPGQGSAVAAFTWNEPFPTVPSRIDVLPVVPPVLP